MFEKWLAATLSKHGPIWLFALVALLMIGPTGIERVFDRFFPPPPAQEVTNDIDRIELRQKGLDSSLLKNQRRILDSLSVLTSAMSNINKEVDGLDMRLVGLEAWKAYRDASIRHETNP